MKPTRRPPEAKGGVTRVRQGEGRCGALVFHNRVEVFRRSSEGVRRGFFVLFFFCKGEGVGGGFGLGCFFPFMAEVPVPD